MLTGTGSPAPPVADALGGPSNSNTTTAAGSKGFCAGSVSSMPFSPGAPAFTSPDPFSSRADFTGVAVGTVSGLPSFGQSNTIAYQVLPLRVMLPHFGDAASAYVVP